MPGMWFPAARTLRRRCVVLVAAVLTIGSAAPASGQTSAAPSPIAALTAAIAAGDGSAGRRQVITTALEAAGLAPVAQSFLFAGREGVNLQVTLPGASSRTLVIGAHYDRVSRGRGVVDNGASCAVLVELLAALKTNPLKQLTVVGVFFDLEELGLQGSVAWFESRRQAGLRLPDFGVNLDVFGYGDTLFATAGRPDGPLAAALGRASTAVGIGLRVFPTEQYPASDHLTMHRAGVETVGVAILPAEEIDQLAGSPAGGQGRPAGRPRIMTLIHSPEDTEAALRPDDVARGRESLEAFLREFDRSLAP